jgi:hypothetical protein
MAADQAPGAAFIAWIKSVPSVHCVAGAVKPWTHDSRNTTVPISKTKHFENTLISLDQSKLTTVASSGSKYWYAAARIPSSHAAVIHAGSEGEEWTYTAVIANVPSPPKPLVALSSAPRTAGKVGLGSTRAEVEKVFGTGNSTSACGYEVVRYEPSTPAASEAEAWFIYRRGAVAAFMHYEAV